MFLETMKSFKAGIIDTPRVIQNVCELFAGHNTLILGFNRFLPPHFEIDIADLPAQSTQHTTQTHSLLSPPSIAGSTPESVAPVHPVPPPIFAAHDVDISLDHQQGQAVQATDQQNDFDRAISYVTRIKTRFSTEPEVYKSFLDILHDYQRNRKPISEIVNQISVLFKDHADLLEEFVYFVPVHMRERAAEDINKVLRRN